MARQFTNNSSVNDSVKVTAQGFTAWGYGTVAAVAYVTGIVANARCLLCFGTDAQDFAELDYRDSGGGGMVFLYNGAATKTSTTAGTTNKWYVIVATKDTGTVTGRGHLFDFAAGTWTHENLSGTQVDVTGTGITQYGIGFDQAGNEAFSPDAHILTSAAWKSRTMTDSEVERLPRGLWDLWSPDLLMEFPSGRDNLTRTTIDCSRNRMRQSASGSQVTRSNLAGPPGFRLSALNRRR